MTQNDIEITQQEFLQRENISIFHTTHKYRIIRLIYARDFKYVMSVLKNNNVNLPIKDFCRLIPGLCHLLLDPDTLNVLTHINNAILKGELNRNQIRQFK